MNKNISSRAKISPPLDAACLTPLRLIKSETGRVARKGKVQSLAYHGCENLRRRNPIAQKQNTETNQATPCPDAPKDAKERTNQSRLRPNAPKDQGIKIDRRNHEKKKKKIFEQKKRKNRKSSPRGEEGRAVD
jgi:hypothetical protein